MIDPKKEFIKLFRDLCRAKQPWSVFSDFCEAATLAISNAILFDSGREQRYLVIAKRDPEIIKEFPKLLAYVVEALEQTPQDFLGSVFQELELSNHWHGQFFTPYHLAKLMAGMTLGDVKSAVKEKGFITISEPACGAGAMAIACYEVVRDVGLLPHQTIHITATDVDPTAAYMCYIQLSLLFVPAIVVVGNTLTLKVQDRLFTPAHVLGFWDHKLSHRNEEQELRPRMTNRDRLQTRPRPSRVRLRLD